MVLYILDTDHLSFYGRNHPGLIAKLLGNQAQLTTTVINVEEQLRGRLAQIAEAKDKSNQSNAYQRLTETVLLLSEFNILQYDTQSSEIYQKFKAQRVRVGTQDLRIASITIANDVFFLTRNQQDFEKVLGLILQDWLG